jgi:hypothetical protein
MDDYNCIRDPHPNPLPKEEEGVKVESHTVDDSSF